MTTPEELCREKFTQDQLNKLLDKASWLALVPVALEMGFNIRRMAGFNYNYVELRDLMKQSWRDKVCMLKLCQASYKQVREENEKQRQIVMDFHLKEKNQ